MGEERYMLSDTMEQLAPQFLWALSDLTEEQRYFTHGTTNPIACTAYHTLRDLDRNVHTVLQGKPSIWEQKNYAGTFGLPPDMRSFGLTHEEASALRVEPWSEFLTYAREVMASTLNYLKNALDEDLETVIKDGRMDTYHTGDYTKVRILRGRLSHASMHLGEIFAQRGFQGMKGAPEGRV